MPTSSTSIRATTTTSTRQYFIPLFVLLCAALLTVLLHRRFDQALELLAPVFLGACVLAVLTGVILLKLSTRNARRRALTDSEIETVVKGLEAGRQPSGAMAIGRSWRVMAAARGMADLHSVAEQALVRNGLRAAGADRLIAERAELQRRKWERVRAIQDLGWLGANAELPVVYRALSDPDDDIAWSAVTALGGMDDDLAYQVLLEMLDDGRFAASRVAQVLDTSRHARPLSVLQERARASCNESLFWIAYLLGRSGDVGAIVPLVELAGHASPNVRASAAEALGRLGDRSAIATLVPMVRDEAWFVRLHACRSLGDLEASNEVAALQTATGDSSWWVRRSAIESLQRLREVAA